MLAIAKLNAAVDRRKDRRALTLDEAYRLIGASPKRGTFYTFALWTGFRMGELKTLTWECLNLSGDKPSYRLKAAHTKSRRQDGDLPLRDDVAALMSAYKPPFAKPEDLVFPRIPKLDTFYRDLERAGIDRHEGGDVDRHGLRTTFISWLGACGVSQQAQVTLGRHSTVGVTLTNYQDFRLLDLWGEVAKLPPIKQLAAQEQATGTDGAVAPVVALTTVPTRLNCPEMAISVCSVKSATKCHSESGNPLKQAKKRHGSGFLIPEKTLGATGFEPATS